MDEMGEKPTEEERKTLRCVLDPPASSFCAHRRPLRPNDPISLQARRGLHSSHGLRHLPGRVRRTRCVLPHFCSPFVQSR